MTQHNVYLRDDWEHPTEHAATRDGFGEGVLEAARHNHAIVVLCADLAESTRVEAFRTEFPERYIEMGVAEQDMATLASGLANYGKLPFITSYAAFSPGRNWEQIRTTIALAELPVVICGMHAGLSVGPDGATHQALEDIGLMRMLPNMTVIVPADAEEARKATIAASRLGRPVYLRFAREKTPVFTAAGAPFEIGKAQLLYESANPQVTLIACGLLVHHALRAAQELAKEGIAASVVNNHTIKPLDEKTILDAAQKAGAVVTIEEHQVAGGMGSSVAELLARKAPVPIEFVGVHDRFGQSGTPEELFAQYDLSVDAIVRAARMAMARRI